MYLKVCVSSRDSGHNSQDCAPLKVKLYANNSSRMHADVRRINDTNHVSTFT